MLALAAFVVLLVSITADVMSRRRYRRLAEGRLLRLRAEQALPLDRPDYAAIASGVWRTQEELADFEEQLGRLRHN